MLQTLWAPPEVLDDSLGSPDRLAAPRVLVVDHEPEVRASLKERLEAEGFDVEVAGSTEDTVAVLDRARVDVVILDVKLQDARCTDLMFFVRHRWAGTAVVLLDGFVGPLGQAAAHRWGAAACFPKPVPVAALVGALRTLVAERGAVRPPAGRLAGAPAPPSPAAGRLQIVVPAGRGGRLRGELRSIAAAVTRGQLVVVGVRDEAAALQEDLAGLPSRPRVLLQPRDRGSAAALLLAAYCIRRSAPDATLAMVPARGRAAGPALVRTLEEASRFVSRYPRWILLIGECADRATAGPWIVPASVLTCGETGPVWRVGAVRRGSRPPSVAGGALAFRGTGVVVAKAARLVSGARQLLPSVHRALLQAVPLLDGEAETAALERAYATIPRLDFGEALLGASVADLAVAEPDGR